MQRDLEQRWRALDDAQLGRQLRAYRDAARLSQKELAGLARVAPSYLSRIEAGTRRPSLPLVDRLTALLRVNLEELVEDTFAIAYTEKSAAVDVARAASRWFHAIGDQEAFDELWTAVKAWEAMGDPQG